MTRITFAEAARRALAAEMRRDPLVWALGEDLVQGGIFGQYKGLAEEFGTERIVSTPISEATIMGAGLGAALCGTRPVIEMRIADFTLCAMDELVSQIAKVRYMFGGQGRAALVVRMPQGMWRNSAAQHSQCLEAWLTHIPGLVVAAPGTPADAAGLLMTAIRSDDPVVLLEPKNLWTAEGEVPEDPSPIPFGVARFAARGDAATVVTWSAPVPVVEQGAAQSGIPCDVIDLRSLWPWDEAAVIASVRRSGRLLVVHEAVTVSGFGAEVVARVVEAIGPAGLRAVERMGAPRAPVPFSPPLENAMRITPGRVAEAIRRVAGA
ncbi:alpha-ketoacid dehydrogenase subunit beta [Roseomonas sp. CECT 9278]|uniref:alpha-ketoacid dehydrogenase subunit beta n=1 Tax=Roseomonas sp. CECT 9278 TaxID=2845823 RepID=UPI001E4C01FA|nr:transketolase C-terminal domain-containing protein [Roseomonas sp. CECT 9278]CAH0182219.1 2-oxoisovalerate dehydrogenase subunit beta [Roseomonas sp. CECT 9278]